jgi:hypothetical protein
MSARVIASVPVAGALPFTLPSERKCLRASLLRPEFLCQLRASFLLQQPRPVDDERQRLRSVLLALSAKNELLSIGADIVRPSLTEDRRERSKPASVQSARHVWHL